MMPLFRRPAVELLTGVSNSNWKWPDIAGLHEFTGRLVHSANWPKDLGMQGQRVAVIGNGSSGIQIVPAIQPGELPRPRSPPRARLTIAIDVKELVHFIRSPTWIVPPRLQTLAAGKAASVLSTIDLDGEQFTDAQIEKFKADPGFYDNFLRVIEKESNVSFPMVRGHTSRAPSRQC